MCTVLLLVAASVVLATKEHFGTPAGTYSILYYLYVHVFLILIRLLIGLLMQIV